MDFFGRYVYMSWCWCSLLLPCGQVFAVIETPSKPMRITIYTSPCHPERGEGPRKKKRGVPEKTDRVHEPERTNVNYVNMQIDMHSVATPFFAVWYITQCDPMSLITSNYMPKFKEKETKPPRWHCLSHLTMIDSLKVSQTHKQSSQSAPLLPNSPAFNLQNGNTRLLAMTHAVQHRSSGLDPTNALQYLPEIMVPNPRARPNPWDPIF